MENDVIEFEQSIDTFNGTKNIEINSGSEGMSDIQAGIEFIYNMREHTLDIGIATVYGIAAYAMILWLKKNIK